MVSNSAVMSSPIVSGVRPATPRSAEVYTIGKSSWRSLALPLPGRHNARNLLLALAVAELLGVPPEQLTALQVDVPDGRYQRRQTDKHIPQGINGRVCAVRR